MATYKGIQYTRQRQNQINNKSQTRGKKLVRTIKWSAIFTWHWYSGYLKEMWWLATSMLDQCGDCKKHDNNSHGKLLTGKFHCQPTPHTSHTMSQKCLILSTNLKTFQSCVMCTLLNLVTQGDWTIWSAWQIAASYMEEAIYNW